MNSVGNIMKNNDFIRELIDKGFRVKYTTTMQGYITKENKLDETDINSIEDIMKNGKLIAHRENKFIKEEHYSIDGYTLSIHITKVLKLLEIDLAEGVKIKDEI